MAQQVPPLPASPSALPSAAQLVRAALQAAREGRYEQASAILRGRLRDGGLTAGQSAELRLALARVLLDAGRPKGSVAELIEVLRIDAHRPDALLLLTEALLACGENSRAEDILGRAQSSGADTQKIHALKLRLAGQPAPPSSDSIPVLIPERDPPTRPKGHTPRALLFEDEPTAPRGSAPSVLDARLDSLEIEMDANPTEPLGWSIGDPGRAGVNHALPPDLNLALDEADDEPQTGSFRGISSAAVREADKRIQLYRARAHAPAHEPQAPLIFDDETAPLGPASVDPPTAKMAQPTQAERDLAASNAATLAHKKREVSAPTLPAPLSFDEDDETQLHPGPRSAPTPVSMEEAPTPRLPQSVHPSLLQAAVNLPTAALPPVAPQAPAPQVAAPPAPLAPIEAPPAPPRLRHSAAVRPIPPPPPPLAGVSVGVAAPVLPNTSALPSVLVSAAPPRPTQRHSAASRASMGAVVAALPEAAPKPSFHKPAPSAPTLAPKSAPTPAPVLAMGRNSTGPIRAASEGLAVKPRVDAAAQQRAQMRDPQLGERLQKLQERRVAGKVDTARNHIRAAAPTGPSAQAPARPAALSPRSLLPLILALTLLGTLLLLALVAWPSFYRRDLLRSLDTHQRLARAQAQGDTYEGYLLASVQLKDGLASQGAAPAPIGALTEGYLEGLGLGGLAQRRRELGAELALTHAVLEQRFGARPDPGSQVLADPLPPSPQERAARAWELLGQGEHVKAEGLLDEALRQWPNDATLLTLHGRALRLQGRRAEALASLERACGLDVAYVPARLELARWYADRRDPRALALFDDVLRNLSVDHEEAALERAQHLLDTRRDLNEARDSLQALLARPGAKVSPRHLSRAHLTLSRYHRLTRAPEEAERALTRAREVDPDLPDPWYEWVDLLATQGRLEEAGRALREARQRFAPSAEQRRLSALVLVLEGRVGEAQEALGVPAKDDPRGQGLYGALLLEDERWAQAEEVLAGALELDPGAAHRADLHLARAAQGRDDALQVLRSEAERDNTPEAAWRYGRALLARGRPADALPYLRRADEADPRGRFRYNLPPSADLCRAHVGARQWTQAKATCARAVERAPSLLPARRALVRLSLRAGDGAGAVEQLLEGLRLAPKDHELQADLMHARLLTGDLDQAERDLNAILTTQEESPKLLYLQGLLLLRQHQPSKALGYLQRAQAASPDPETRLALAWAHLEEERPGQARDALSPLLRDPDWQPVALVALAEAKRQESDWEGSLTDARQAIRLLEGRPDLPVLYRARAWTLVGRVLPLRPRAKDSEVQEALDRATTLGDPLGTYLNARNHANQDELYLSLLRRAVQRDPYYCSAVQALRKADSGFSSPHCQRP